MSGIFRPRPLLLQLPTAGDITVGLGFSALLHKKHHERDYKIGFLRSPDPTGFIHRNLRITYFQHLLTRMVILVAGFRH